MIQRESSNLRLAREEGKEQALSDVLSRMYMMHGDHIIALRHIIEDMRDQSLSQINYLHRSILRDNGTVE